MVLVVGNSVVIESKLSVMNELSSMIAVGLATKTSLANSFSKGPSLEGIPSSISDISISNFL